MTPTPCINDGIPGPGPVERSSDCGHRDPREQTLLSLLQEAPPSPVLALRECPPERHDRAALRPVTFVTTRVDSSLPVLGRAHRASMLASRESAAGCARTR